MITLREFARAVLPPALLNLLRGQPVFPQRRFTWVGIYSHVRDVPATHTYNVEAEVQKHVNLTRLAVDSLRNYQKPFFRWHHSLGLVAATLAASSGRVRILDFGGAVGSGYLQVLATVPNSVVIEYHVVDLEKFCAAGQHLFANDPCITFYTSMPALRAAVDMVYVNSALQYIEDYVALLQQVAALEAPFVLLARLAAGSCPTFATRQVNLHDVALPYWFLNLKEVCEVMRGSGYALSYEGLNGEEELDQTNFPNTHRVGPMRDLLFRRMLNANN